MSLDYRLWLATDLEPAQIEEIIAGVRGFKRRPECIQGPRVTATADVARTSTPNALQAAYGFLPARYVLFIPEKQQPNIKYALAIIRASVAVLSKTKADGVLLFNGWTVLLIQRGSKLVLDEDYGWTPDRLAVVNVPYKIKKVPRCDT